MEETNLLQSLERVNAPPDFEQKVLAGVRSRKMARERRRRTLGLSFAGAAAVLIISLISLNILVFQKKSPAGTEGLTTSVLESPAAGQTMIRGDLIPIIEAVDYSGEIRGSSVDPQSIYILEQVSDTSSTEIIY
jgi:hypothetical protein